MVKETMNLRTLRCIQCQAPLSPKETDRAVECGSCHTHMLIEDGDLVPLMVTVVDFTREEDLPRIFIPFWVVDAEITIRNEQVRGGRVSRLIHGRKRMEGEQRFFVCAADLPADTETWWNRTITATHVPITTGKGSTGGEAKLPVTLPGDDAREEAEFLFLNHELDESGNLQSIDYDFVQTGLNLVYLPFYQENDRYISGLSALRDAVPPAAKPGKEPASRLDAVSGAVSGASAGGFSWLMSSRAHLLAGVGIVLIVIAIILAFSGLLPIPGIFLSAGQDGDETTTTPIPTTIAIFTVLPTDAVPRGTEVVIQVQKNPPHNLVTAIFAGGPGQRVVKSCEVILTTSDGVTKTRTLEPIINNKVT
ncbi:MAG TPA: hypothetical protein ENO06_00600, partial [Methanolinea sp.]|nr:hypothetical protein [Methanolinea sp.]